MINEDFKKLYKSGAKVAVDFIKRDGTKRHMVCQRDPVMESQVKGAIEKHTDSTLRVVEIKDDGTHQWRAVPLDRIESFTEI